MVVCALALVAGCKKKRTPAEPDAAAVAAAPIDAAAPASRPLQTIVLDEVEVRLHGAAEDALVSREAVVGAVCEVVKRVREERELRIHVNPSDLPVLRTAEAGIEASLPGRRFTLVSDGRVESGGCIVESTLGSLDGRLEVQLAELCATLRAAKAGAA